jgi:hypothetical protein
MRQLLFCKGIYFASEKLTMNSEEKIGVFFEMMLLVATGADK